MARISRRRAQQSNLSHRVTLLLASLALASGGVSSAEPASAPRSRIIVQDDQGLTVEIEVPSPRLASRHGRVDVRLDGYGTLTEPGRPALPIRAERIALPPGAEPALTVLLADPVPLADAKPAPFPRIVVPNGKYGHGDGARDILLEEDASVYRGNKPFPERPVRLGTIGALREVPFVELLVEPVFYDPRSGMLGYYPKMTVRIDFAPAVIPSPRFAPEMAPGELFEPSLSSVFLNAAQARRVAQQAAEQGSRPGGLTETPTGVSGSSAEQRAFPFSPSAQPTAPAAGSSTRYKMTVNKDGIYRLGFSWVQANAPDLLNFAPSRYRIMDLGVEIPITVVDSTGDGTFNSGDYIEFTGQKLTWDILDPDDWQKGDWTDDNVYWLDATPSAGLRIPTRDGTPSGTLVATEFVDTLHSEADDLFIQGVPYDQADHWHQRPSVQSTDGTPTSQTFSVTVHDQTTTTGAQASIKVKLLGDNYTNNYHRTNIYVNGHLVDGCGDGIDGCGNEAGGCVDWDGFIEFTHGETNGTVHFCQSDLSTTTNIKVELPMTRVVNGNSITADTVYMDWVEITYNHKLQVNNDALTFTLNNSSTKVKVTGLSTNKAAVYEVTNTLPDGHLLNPVRIINQVLTQNGSTYDLTFNITTDGTLPPKRRFMVATVTTSNSTGDLEPASVKPYTPSDIRNPAAGADWLVIGDTDVMDSSPTSGFQKLVAYRRDSQGKRVKTVTVEQVYDEFSYGIFDPQAIRDFLSYAYNNWPQGPGGKRLSEVLLVGDTTFDTKNNYGAAGKRIWVPTYMHTLSTNSIVGYYSDDVYFAKIVGNDELPDLHLGRLPVHSMTESNSTCQKILDYEQQASGQLWQHNVVLTAENKDPDFKQVSEDTRMKYLDGTPHTYNRIYQQDLEPYYPDPQQLANEVKDRIQRNLNGQVEPARDIGPGSAVFAFVGHGSWQNWGQTYSTFLTASSGPDDLDPVNNYTKLPFLFISNCLSGGFHVTSRPGNTDLTYAFTEDFLTTANKGAVATLAPGHLTYLNNISLEYDVVFGQMYGPHKERNVGQVAEALREAFAGNLAYVDLRSFALLADPATTLAMPAPKPPTNVKVVSQGDKQIGLSWTASPDAAKYRVFRSTQPDGTYNLVGDNIASTSFTDTGLTNCTTYYYQVASLDSGGFEGRRSNFNVDCPGMGDCVSGTPRKPTPPGAPTGLVLTDRETGDRMTASWNANPASDEVTGYTLRWSTIPNDPNPPNQLGTSTTTATLTGLTNGVKVYATVTATNCSQGEGSRSAPEAFGTPVNTRKGIKPPLWITDLKVSRSPDPGDHKDDILLQWGLPTTDIWGKPESLSQVRVYHNTAGPQFSLDSAHLLATLGATATSYIHEDAFFDSSKHYYLVVTVDTDGNLSGGGHNLLKGIDNMTARRVSSTQLMLSWGAILQDLDGRYNPANTYKVYGQPTVFTRSQTPSMTPTTTTGATSVTLAMPSDSTYYYSVVAVDARGNESPW